MPYNKEAARRGNEVVERGSGGTYRPFLPQIFWQKDGDSSFVLILNPLDDIARLDFHPYVDTEIGPRKVIARTDPGIGERVDPLEREWGYQPRLTDIAIAVELEPVFEHVTVNGRDRNKVVGFEVATRTFERRIRDDDGELTDEKEEATAPALGWIAESPYMLGNQLNSYEHSENPINLTPFKITKVGSGSGSSLRVEGFPDASYDLTNLLEYIDEVSYIQEPDEVLELIDDLDQEEAAIAIGQYVLDLKIEELADIEYYDEVFLNTQKVAKYAKGSKTSAKSEKTEAPKAEVKKNTRASSSSAQKTTGTAKTAKTAKVTKTTSNAVDARARIDAIRAKKAEKDQSVAEAA